MSGVIAIADAIPDMGALTKLDISSNMLYGAGCKVLAEALSGNKIMAELNLAGNRLSLKWGASHDTPDTSGIATLADVIPGMGALSILNMSKNGMKGSKAGKAFGDALATNTALRELDLSGQPETSEQYATPNMDAACMKALAPGLSDNGAMTSLNLANNIAKEEDIISPPRQGLQEGDMVDGKTVTTIHETGNIRVTDLSGIAKFCRCVAGVVQVCCRCCQVAAPVAPMLSGVAGCHRVANKSMARCKAKAKSEGK
jgi:hypothetical protein